MEKRDQEKEAIQTEAENLSTIHKNLVLQWATGCGKTKGVLRCIRKAGFKIPWLVLVPENLQIENLKREIEKHGFSDLLEKGLEIICYASFKNYKGKTYNLWFNEVHRLSELREDIAKTINFERFIADSATIPKEVLKRLSNLGQFFDYRITLREAINKGILPEPKIHIIEINANNHIKRNPYLFGKKEVLLTDAQYLAKVDDRIMYLIKKKEEADLENTDSSYIYMKLIREGSARKRKLAWFKNEALKKLVEELGGTRFVCFTGSIEQCNMIGGKNAVNSQKTRKQNTETINKFNTYQISQIFLNKMGREGMNLEGIEAVIIVQLGTGEDDGLEFIQTVGRSLRGAEPNVYILVIKDSADEKFVKKAIAHLKK